MACNLSKFSWMVMVVFALFIFTVQQAEATDTTAVPCIKLTKTAPEKAFPGDKITYKLEVENCGDTNFASGEAWIDDYMFGRIWSGDLYIGDVKTFSREYTVLSSDCGELVNTATAYGSINTDTNPQTWDAESTAIVITKVDCPKCGDGHPDEGEECDDGNTTSGDGCDMNCKKEFCGDEIVQPFLNEECDDGNTTSGDGCDMYCQEEFCGDEIVQSGLGEECDDGNATSGDGCDKYCQDEFCGDGIVQPGLGEECDDGNTTSGDGCSADCKFEGDGYTGTPGYWKNHPDAWPKDMITIGGMTYSKDDAIDILLDKCRETEKGSDKTITMFQALVAAKLNVMNGAESSCIAATIAAADAWMTMNGPVCSDIDASSMAWMKGEPMYFMLDNYNNGKMCAPHRD